MKIIAPGGDGSCGCAPPLSARGRDIAVPDNLPRRRIDMESACSRFRRSVRAKREGATR